MNVCRAIMVIAGFAVWLQSVDQAGAQYGVAADRCTCCSSCEGNSGSSNCLCSCGVVAMAFCPLGCCGDCPCLPQDPCQRQQLDAWNIKHWLDSSCDMPQHMAYKLPEDGYYYFRPYNYTMVPAQQDFVSQWGGDVRNPYSCEVFDQLRVEELPAPESKRSSRSSSGANRGWTTSARPAAESSSQRPIPSSEVEGLGVVW